MTVTNIRVLANECMRVYEGVSKSSGNPYTVGTWKVSSVLDGKNFIVTAFGKEHETLKNLTAGVMVDCSITITAKEYNGAWYNDVSISNIELPGGVKEDLPQSEPAPLPEPTFAGEENDLPF